MTSAVRSTSTAAGLRLAEASSGPPAQRGTFAALREDIQSSREEEQPPVAVLIPCLS